LLLGRLYRCAGLGRNAVVDATEDDRPPLDETLTNRRRPGRADYENAHLIALLRDQPIIADPTTAEVDAVPKARWSADLSPARGILIGLPIGAAIWALIVFAIWLAT
jgi:hypothetical protein